MGIAFRQETFRDDFSFRNSPAGIRRFPFPFDRDDYMYAVNIEAHTKGRAGSVFENLIDVDEHYVAEMEDLEIHRLAVLGCRDRRADPGAGVCCGGLRIGLHR